MGRTANIIAAIAACLVMLPAKNMAQTDPEYLMEIGGGVGLVSYEGDFNGNITKEAQPIASLVARRILNPYMALKLSASYGKIKGSSENVETYMPDMQENPYTFDNNIADLSLTYEYNFWPYGTGRDYRGAKRLVPFVFGGIGATYANPEQGNVFTANIPIGLGAKYKLTDRLNLGVEWTAHFSLSDELDGVKDPYYIKSSGAFKNTDCYSYLRVTLTYSFMAKCRTCHNADE